MCAVEAITVVGTGKLKPLLTIAKLKKQREWRKQRKGSVEIFKYYSTTGHTVLASYNEPGSLTEDFLFICL